MQMEENSFICFNLYIKQILVQYSHADLLLIIFFSFPLDLINQFILVKFSTYLMFNINMYTIFFKYVTCSNMWSKVPFRYSSKMMSSDSFFFLSHVQKLHLRHTSIDSAINISAQSVSWHKLLLEKYPVSGYQLQPQWETVVKGSGTLQKTLMFESACRLFALCGKLPWSSCLGSLCVMMKRLMLTGLNTRRSITLQVILRMIFTSDIQVSMDIFLQLTEDFF